MAYREVGMWGHRNNNGVSTSDNVQNDNSRGESGATRYVDATPMGASEWVPATTRYWSLRRRRPCSHISGGAQGRDRKRPPV